MAVSTSFCVVSLFVCTSGEMLFAFNLFDRLGGCVLTGCLFSRGDAYHTLPFPPSVVGIWSPSVGSGVGAGGGERTPGVLFRVTLW